MKKEIRILCVEDVPADVVMLNHALRQGGLKFRSKLVDNEKTFIYELEHNPPDVILSDHGLPSFDGFMALTIAHAKCPDIPFIFVTGKLGEQIAVETLKNGATDYILKRNLSKLVPAIERALHEAEERAILKQKELQLRESEERYRRLVEFCPDAFLVLCDGKIVFANMSAVRLLGVADADQLIGKPMMEIVHPDSRQSLETRFSQLMENGTTFFWRKVEKEKAQARNEPGAMIPFVEEEFVRSDGTTVKVEVATAPLTLQDRQAVQIIARDITMRKHSEEKLHRSESLKTLILETALDAIISIDHEGKIQEWNPAAQKIFGYSRDETVGQPMDELIVPAALWEVYHDGLTNYLMTGVGSLIGKPVELTLRRKDGEEFRAEMAISRILSEDPPRCTALIRDVTGRKASEERLRRSEERLRMLVESAKDYAIYMLDLDGNVVTWNSGAERINGYRAEEIIGKPFAIFFTPEDVKAGAPDEELKQAKTEGRALYEGWRVRKDGSRFWVHGTVTAMRDEDGKLYGFSKIAHDITKEKEAEDKIYQLNEQLEQRVRERTSQLEASNKELEAFSYSISHDLRAPLRHIAGYVEILQNEAADKLDKQEREHLQTIAGSAKNLGDLIDALLAFSRMGRSEMRYLRVNLADLVEEARRESCRDIEGRNIDWHIEKLPQVQGDPLMLRQVIINLVSNALKYTRKRKQARIEIGATDSENETIIFVRDNGVGFDMKYVDKLFGVFQRLHNGNEFEGIGIGLANVRRIIHRHGGRVWAEGKVDGGATFYFSIPKTQNGKEKL